MGKISKEITINLGLREQHFILNKAIFWKDAIVRYSHLPRTYQINTIFEM